MTDANTVPSRIRWKCRRGMREMDILLTRFVESEFATLDATERAQLERLLECPDQDILTWVTGACEPTETQLSAIVARMRTALCDQ